MRNSRRSRSTSSPFWIASWLLAIAVGLCLPSSAGAVREKVVEKVEVVGNRRLDPTAILSRIKTQPGNLFLQEDTNADLKRLYEWGPFASIEVEVRERVEGKVEVIFKVKEKPIIGKILFEGNRRFDDKKLENEITSRIGQVLTEAQLKEDLAQLESLYEEKGYLQARASYQVKSDPESLEAVVIFLILEGREVRIERVTIEGAEQIREGELRGMMTTKPRSLFSILHRGIFKKEEFEADQEKLILYYRSQGFLDMKMLAPPELTYSADGSKMFIRLVIEEGPRYFSGEIKFSGNESFPAAELEESLRLQPGEVFNFTALREDTRALKDFYASRGYIDASIRPRPVLDQQTQRMDIEYVIQENQISYINRIEISGNQTTRDRVIRRELAVRPGEIFDGVKVQRSQERLYNLGYFERVSIEPLATTVPNKKDLMLQVEERKTGEFMFGFGYSSIDDFIGFAEIGQGNFDLFNPPFFMGGGQKLRVRAEFGTTRDSYELSFTEPWLFGIPLSFGVDFYRRDWSWSDYRETRKGGDLRLRKRLAEFIQMGLTYRLEQVEIGGVSDDAYWAIQSEEGKKWISSITPSLSRDTRDSNLIPSRGMRNVLACEIAGGIFGGDKDYVKTSFTTSVYHSIFSGHVLGFHFRLGSVQPYGDTEMVPIYEKFYLGGANTIRGFRYREVGPFDPETEEPIGGDSMAMASVEYTFPIITMVRGALFCDIGNVWASKDFDDGDRPLSSNWLEGLNSGAGFGVRLYLPIGPIKLDYAWPLRTGPDDWNDTGGRFHFNIGYAF